MSFTLVLPDLWLLQSFCSLLYNCPESWWERGLHRYPICVFMKLSHFALGLSSIMNRVYPRVIVSPSKNLSHSHCYDSCVFFGFIPAAHFLSLIYRVLADSFCSLSPQFSISWIYLLVLTSADFLLIVILKYKCLKYVLTRHYALDTK